MLFAVIGDGGWGTTLAVNLSKSGNDVRLWSPFPEYAKQLCSKRENAKFLPGVPIPKDIEITSDIIRTVSSAEFIILAVPSPYIRDVLEKIKRGGYSQANFVSAIKGVECGTLLRMSEIITEILGRVKLSVLSGPSIAYEVARGIPTTVVSASSEAELAACVQSAFMTDKFRVYVSSDVVGVELGGAFKNVIAIASGIADGLGFGANSKAAILTRGMQEIARLGQTMGAKRETFSGLSCMGDLITTCMSKHSRNRWFGEEIGKGKKPDAIIKSTEMAVEGYVTTKSAYELSKKQKVDMPITAQMYEILYNGKDPKEAVKALMLRSPKKEIYQ